MELTPTLAGSPLSVTVAGDDAWASFVAGSADATFCHLLGWRDVMEDTLFHETLFRAAVDAEGRVAGVLPLARVRSRLFGDYLVSMPFLNYGGAIGSESAQAVLNGWAADTAASLGSKLLELRARHASPTQGGLRTTHRKVTVVLDLPDTPDALLAAFPAKLRSQVRRPLKEGMHVRFGADQAAPFYDIYARNMRDLGTPVLPRHFFERLPAVFGDTVQFATVWHGDVPVAAGAGFHHGGEYEMTWASSLREYNRFSPNMLLYWGCMEEAVRRGASTFNFGRCTPGGGTHRFKLQWGSRDVPLPWLQGGRAHVAATPTADGGAFRMATACWKRLPVGLTRVLGPPLARCIP